MTTQAARSRREGGRGHGAVWRAVVPLLVAVGLAVAFTVLAPAAGAYPSYKHGTATTCAACHPGGDTSVPLTDTACTSCHTGFVSRPSGSGARTCWTCHAPGQDMSSVQTATGCGPASDGSGCHSGPRHLGSNLLAGCTACHGVAASATDPDGSAHHTTTAYTTPTCATCHTATPHEEYLTGVACGDCHVGVAPVHPAATAMAVPKFTASASPNPAPWNGNAVVNGKLLYGTTPLAGVLVTVQERPAGLPDFTTLTSASTGSGGTVQFGPYVAAAPVDYRLVSRGTTVGATVVRPALATVTVKRAPTVTIKLSATGIVLGKSVTVKGSVAPARPGGSVKLTFQRKVSGVWKTVLTKTRTLSSSSTYSFAYKPLKKGSYRVRCTVPATSDLVARSTVWKSFTVK